jgi:hypothetical protein
MQRISSFSPLSLLPIVLSAGCYWSASFFHGQYARASGVVSRAIHEAKSRGDISGDTLVGLPSPETYFTRAELMFLVAILVCAVTLVLAVRHKHWTDWLAVLIATVITFTIPMHVLWRL